MYYEFKASRTKRKRVMINITPLIDVLFLLLIFFIVSSTFLEQPSITVELPSAKTAEPQPVDQYIIMVAADGVIYVNDIKIEEEQLLTRLMEIAKTDVQAPIVLKADKNAPYGKIIHLIDTVRQSGLKKIVALTKIGD